MKKTLAIAAIVAGLVLAAAGYYKYAPRHVPAGQPPLASLDFPDFQRQFNEAAGQVRVLTLLSPT